MVVHLAEYKKVANLTFNGEILHGSATGELFNCVFLHRNETFVSAPLLQSEFSLRPWRGIAKPNTRGVFIARVNLFFVISIKFRPPRKSKTKFEDSTGKDEDVV